MNPVAVIRGALNAIASEDAEHRRIMLDAVEDELSRIRGGCRCERLLKAATCLPDDVGEPAQRLLQIALCDVRALAGHGQRPGMAAGLAVIASTATRLASECVETPSD